MPKNKKANIAGVLSECENCGNIWTWTGTKDRKCPSCGKRNVIDKIEIEGELTKEIIETPQESKEEAPPTVKVDKSVLDFTHNVLHSGSVLVSRVVGNWIVLTPQDHKDLDEPTARIMGKGLVKMSKYNDWLMFIYGLGIVASRKIEAKDAFDSGQKDVKNADLDNYLKGITK